MNLNLKLPKEKALRLAVQVSLALFLLTAGYAAMLFMEVGKLESSLAQSGKAGEESAAAAKGAQAKLAAASTRLAELEKKQSDADSFKVLMSSVEPQIAPVLEAAGRAGRPGARAAALTALGLIGQGAHGANNDAALAVLERAVAIDKTYCPAGLAINLSGVKKVDVAPECLAFLPVPADAKAAAPAPAAPAPAAAK